MSQKWNRELVIRHILKCVAEGRPLTVGEPGISQSLYQAGSRFFGSWRNAIQAAGLRPELGNCIEKWPPARILTLIRSLARRRHPLNARQLEHRYGNMVPIEKREPVLIAKTGPVEAAGVGWRARRARVAQLGTRVNARSDGGPGVVA